MRVLAFDFDGVLCNSIDECMLSSLSAHNIIEGKNNELFKIVENVPPEFKNAFRKWRYLVGPAKEYGALCRAITLGYAIESNFNLFSKDKNHLSVFEIEFFRFRNAWRSSNPEDWLGMHAQYPNFQYSWSILHSLGEIRIVTNKDLASVKALNDCWKLNLEDEWIWCKERNTTKSEAILNIAKELEISVSEVHFIDDDPKYLQEVSKTGAVTYWASWGYAPSHRLSKQYGYQTATSLEDFHQKVNHYSGR